MCSSIGVHVDFSSVALCVHRPEEVKGGKAGSKNKGGPCLRELSSSSSLVCANFVKVSHTVFTM